MSQPRPISRRIALIAFAAVAPCAVAGAVLITPLAQDVPYALAAGVSLYVLAAGLCGTGLALIMHAEESTMTRAPAQPPLTAGELIRELEHHAPQLPVRFAGRGGVQPVSAVRPAPSGSDPQTGAVELRP